MQAKSLSFPSLVYLANLVFAGQDLNYKGKTEEEEGCILSSSSSCAKAQSEKREESELGNAAEEREKGKRRMLRKFRENFMGAKRNQRAAS